MKEQFGQLYVFEGMDRTGKTTLMNLVAERLREAGYDVRVSTAFGPPESELGQTLRQMVVDRKEGMDPNTEALLFMAARRHLLQSYVRPALRDGSIVLLDRASMSTLVFQGMIGNVGGNNLLTAMKTTGSYVLGDRIYLVGADQASRASRKRASDDVMDGDFESRSEDIRDAFDFVIREVSNGHVHAVDNSNGKLEEAADEIVNDIKNHYRFMNTAGKPSSAFRT